MGRPEERRKKPVDIKFQKLAMGGLCSKKKIADAETENNENEENTDKTPVGERRPTKGAGLLGKTEWTDDEDEEEEGVAIEDAPTLSETVYDAPPEADVPTSPTEANENETLKSPVDDRPEVEPEVPAE